MTWQEALRYAEEKLSKAEVPEARLNAWYLFAHVLAITRSEYFLREKEILEEGRQEQFEALLEKRSHRMPLEYLTGETEFMGLPFYVNEKVLIPRQDTECLVEEILPLVEGKTVLDLCTGSGCIGISLAVLGKSHRVWLSDLSVEALEVARENAKRNQVVVTLNQGNLFENISERFDVIVSNPPYIESAECDRLMPEVKDYEPRMALDGREDGLYFYREIIRQSVAYLKKDGWLWFEIGCHQGKQVVALMKETGYEQVMIKKDLAGLDRIVGGRLCLIN